MSMNEQLMIKIAEYVGAWLGGVLLIVLLLFSINYRITETHLLITLFGLPIRRIKIRDIRHMGTETKGWAERWYNTLSPLNRRLVIRRKSGLLFKTMIITPRNPYLVMHDLEQAKQRLKAAEAGGAPRPTSRSAASKA
ncbi:MAG TPA: hypothetical protein DCM86_09065 [Verrucomicrobiales bacterium]|nr:hypothetical protein [Verrucomicrobiales bacterium]